jgi:hypothetical protein
MPRRGRAVLSGLALAAFFALPLLPEILGTRRLVFRDAQITHWPWRRVAMESLASGRIPFVNASSSGGQPLLANPNAVLLYPTVLLERVVGPASAFNLHYLLHVLWAFFGARLLARRLGRSEGAAFFGGVAFAFSGVLLSYASAFANSSAAAAWLPWCGCAALALARASDARQWRRGIAALALALGLQLLAGEPAISGLTLLLVAGIGVADRVAHPFRPRPRRAPIPPVERGRGNRGGALRGPAPPAAPAGLLSDLPGAARLFRPGVQRFAVRAVADPGVALPALRRGPGRARRRGALAARLALRRGSLPLVRDVRRDSDDPPRSRRDLARLLAPGRDRDRGRKPPRALPRLRSMLRSSGSRGFEALRRLRYPIKFYC